MVPERPMVRCLAAFPLAGGHVTTPRLVPLDFAAALKARGWWIVGPDPLDMHALAQWQRVHSEG
jgi:hypothetical protein